MVPADAYPAGTVCVLQLKPQAVQAKPCYHSGWDLLATGSRAVRQLAGGWVSIRGLSWAVFTQELPQACKGYHKLK